MALILSGGNGGNATITGNSGNLTISNAANIFTGSAVVSTTGNVTGGNLFTAGIMSSTGNITGSNILTAGLISSTGNISAGNISVAGALSTASKGISASSLPAGTILQVVQTVKTDSMAAVPGAVYTDVPGQGGSGTFSATITPSSASNKILIIVDMKGSGSQDNSVIRSRLLRDSTAIYVGDASSNRPRGMGQFYIASGGAAGGYYLAQLGGTFLDSPATTSAVTYKMQFGGDGTSLTLFINRTQGDRDTAFYDSRIPASITLMEIAA